MSDQTGSPRSLSRRSVLRTGLVVPAAALVPGAVSLVPVAAVGQDDISTTAADAQPVTAAALYKRMEPIATDPIPGPVAEMEAMMLEFVNDERRERGVRALQPDTVLAQAARYHSHDMNDRDYFDHVSPDGVGARQRIGTWHRWLVGQVGENLWLNRVRTRDTRALAKLAIDGWMKSPSHRDNLLQADFTHVGIGAAQSGDTWRITQALATVKSYLTKPAPVSIRRGETLDLAVDERGGSLVPGYYGLARPGDEELTFGPYPPSDSRIVAAAGDYEIWFFIQEQSYFRIYEGPWLTVVD